MESYSSAVSFKSGQQKLFAKPVKKQKKDGIVIIASGNPALEDGDDAGDNGRVEDRDDAEENEGLNDIEMITKKKVENNDSNTQTEEGSVIHIENEGVADILMINERKVAKNHNIIQTEGLDIQHVRVENEGVDDILMINERKVDNSTQTEEGLDIRTYTTYTSRD